MLLDSTFPANVPKAYRGLANVVAGSGLAPADLARLAEATGESIDLAAAAPRA